MSTPDRPAHPAHDAPIIGERADILRGRMRLGIHYAWQNKCARPRECGRPVRRSVPLQSMFRSLARDVGQRGPVVADRSAGGSGLVNEVPEVALDNTEDGAALANTVLTRNSNEERRMTMTCTARRQARRASRRLMALESIDLLPGVAAKPSLSAHDAPGDGAGIMAASEDRAAASPRSAA